ncbi:class I SAM-dependent methyltransferase [Pseudoalteromonas sp. T1lg88]|uniref:class I SAM-dependent methyltransferase n=1 Tax=Pseudoalteromonas sp. T1lg88 TaxID=2077104 RepID=UPI000CF5E5EC|nr:class I SAM-dependent methyltransferase [Pseudoalteromonas sp. T1lg88]
MQEFDRKAHWQNVYEHKEVTEVSWFQAKSALSLELIANSHLEPSAPIIDVGGGASVLVDQLLDQGYTNLTVLDISGAALAKSAKRLGEKAGAVNWLESDVTAFSPDSQVALWHDRAVFHFLTDAAERQRYVGALKKTLRLGGHLIIAAFAIGGPEKCSGLPIVQYDAAKLIAELGPEFRLLEERIEEHITPAQRVQKFAYFRFERIVENEIY